MRAAAERISNTRGGTERSASSFYVLSKTAGMAVKAPPRI